MGFAALVATFWLLVATVRLILTHECPASDHVARVAATAPPTAPLPTAKLGGEKAWRGDDCGLPHPHERARSPEPSRTALSKTALIAGLNAVRPQITACYLAYDVPGLAMVNVVIARNGRVTSAGVTGKFAGTPTGACVERAVKTASFPPSDGFSTPYPFQLR